MLKGEKTKEKWDLTSKDLEKLSRWACVAIAARCALRVLHVFERPRRSWISFEQIVDIRNAIGVALHLAATGSVEEGQDVARAGTTARTTAYRVAEATNLSYSGVNEGARLKAEIVAASAAAHAAAAAARTAEAAYSKSNNVNFEAHDAYFWAVKAAYAGGCVTAYKSAYEEFEKYAARARAAGNQAAAKVRDAARKDFYWLIANVGTQDITVPAAFWPEVETSLYQIAEAKATRKARQAAPLTIVSRNLPELGDSYMLVASIGGMDQVLDEPLAFVDWWCFRKKRSSKILLICRSTRHLEPLFDIVTAVERLPDSKLICLGADVAHRLFSDLPLTPGCWIRFNPGLNQKQCEKCCAPKTAPVAELLTIDGRIYCSCIRNTSQGPAPAVCDEYRCISIGRRESSTARIDKYITILEKECQTIGTDIWKEREWNLFGISVLVLAKHNPNDPNLREVVTDYCRREKDLVKSAIKHLQREKLSPQRLPYLPRRAALLEICRSHPKMALYYLKRLGDNIISEEREDQELFMRMSEHLVRAISDLWCLDRLHNCLPGLSPSSPLVPFQITCLPWNRANAVKRLCDEIGLVWYERYGHSFEESRTLFQELSDYMVVPWTHMVQELVKRLDLTLKVEILFLATQKVIHIEVADSVAECFVPESLAPRLGALPTMAYHCSLAFILSKPKLKRQLTALANALKPALNSQDDPADVEMAAHMVAACVCGPCYLSSILRFYEYVTERRADNDNKDMAHIVKGVMSILDELDLRSKQSTIEFDLPPVDIKKMCEKFAMLARQHIEVYTPTERKNKAGDAKGLLATGISAKTDPVNLLNALWDSVVESGEYVNEWALYLSLSQSRSATAR